MNQEAMIRTMKDSISEVFETMFFVPLDFDDAVDAGALKGDRLKEEMLSARLEFEGPLSGEFFFMIPKRLALSLTAGFMGEEIKAVCLDKIYGTVTEMINMVAGNFFSRLDNKAVFDLGLPEIFPEQEAWPKMISASNSVRITMNTGESPMILQMIYRES